MIHFIYCAQELWWYFIVCKNVRTTGLQRLDNMVKTLCKVFFNSSAFSPSVAATRLPDVRVGIPELFLLRLLTAFQNALFDFG